MADSFPTLDPDDLIRQAVSNLQQVLSPRQLYLLSTRLIELQKRGFGEIHLTVSEGHVNYVRMVQSDKVTRL